MSWIENGENLTVKGYHMLIDHYWFLKPWSFDEEWANVLMGAAVTMILVGYIIGMEVYKMKRMEKKKIHCKNGRIAIESALLLTHLAFALVAGTAVYVGFPEIGVLVFITTVVSMLHHIFVSNEFLRDWDIGNAVATAIVIGLLFIRLSFVYGVRLETYLFVYLVVMGIIAFGLSEPWRKVGLPVQEPPAERYEAHSLWHIFIAVAGLFPFTMYYNKL